MCFCDQPHSQPYSLGSEIVLLLLSQVVGGNFLVFFYLSSFFTFETMKPLPLQFSLYKKKKNLILTQPSVLLSTVPLPNTSGLFKEGSLAPLVADSSDSDFSGALSPGSATSSGNYRCPHCGQSFASPHAAKDHLEVCFESGSGSGGLLPCLQCNAVFSSRDLLEKHELLHSPNAQVVSVSVLCFFPPNNW